MSGVNNLDGSAEELYQKSQLALSRLSSELSAHSSCIMDVRIDVCTHLLVPLCY